MKELYNRTELELLAAHKFTFNAHPVLYVTAGRKSLASESITATFELEIGQEVIGEFTQEYDCIERLCARSRADWAAPGRRGDLSALHLAARAVQADGRVPRRREGGQACIEDS